MTSKVGDYCSVLHQTLFPSRESLNQRQIDRIDVSLKSLYDNNMSKQTQLKELKNSLAKLSDKNNKLDPSVGMPRSTLIQNTKKRMKTILMHTKSLQQNITFFEQVKYNLENSHMTNEMAAHVKSLKQQLANTGAINIDELQDDVDTIAEVNDDIQEVNNLMKDTMTNAWAADMDDADDMLNEYLMDSDVEEDETILAPDEQYIEPRITSIGNLKSQVLPSVPENELEVPTNVFLTEDTTKVKINDKNVVKEFF